MRINYLFVFSLAFYCNICAMIGASQEEQYRKESAKLEEKLRAFEATRTSPELVQKPCLQQPLTFLTRDKIAQIAHRLYAAMQAYSDNYFEYFTQTARTPAQLSKLAQDCANVSLTNSICSAASLIIELTRSNPQHKLLTLAINSIPEIKLNYYLNNDGNPSFSSYPERGLQKDHTSNYKKQMLALVGALDQK